MGRHEPGRDVPRNTFTEEAFLFEERHAFDWRTDRDGLPTITVAGRLRIYFETLDTFDRFAETLAYLRETHPRSATGVGRARMG